MSDDLIQWLRKGGSCDSPCRSMRAESGCTCTEAADRIEALEAAIDAALAELDASLFTNAEHQRAKVILRTAREATK